MRVIRKAAVTVPEEVPGAVMALVPDSHRVVAQHQDLRAAIDLHRHLEQVVDGLEERCKLRPCSAISKARIVIAEHKNHVPASNPGAIRRGITASKAEVTQVIEPVVGRDPGIDAVDDRGVHFLNARERPLAVLDDVGVAEVGVCGEEDRHARFLAHCTPPPHTSDHSLDAVRSAMIEIQIHRLPGGDASRRSTMARITLTNTGEGVGGVKVYEVRLAEADERVGGEVVSTECRTHRDADEGVLQLVSRALLRLTASTRNK